MPSIRPCNSLVMNSGFNWHGGKSVRLEPIRHYWLKPTYRYPGAIVQYAWVHLTGSLHPHVRRILMVSPLTARSNRSVEASAVVIEFTDCGYVMMTESVRYHLEVSQERYIEYRLVSGKTLADIWTRLTMRNEQLCHSRDSSYERQTMPR